MCKFSSTEHGLVKRSVRESVLAYCALAKHSIHASVLEQYALAKHSTRASVLEHNVLYLSILHVQVF